MQRRVVVRVLSSPRWLNLISHTAICLLHLMQSNLAAAVQFYMNYMLISIFTSWHRGDNFKNNWRPYFSARPTEHDCLRALMTALAIRVAFPNVLTHLLTYLLRNSSVFRELMTTMICKLRYNWMTWTAWPLCYGQDFNTTVITTTKVKCYI